MKHEAITIRLECVGEARAELERFGRLVSDGWREARLARILEASAWLAMGAYLTLDSEALFDRLVIGGTFSFVAGIALGRAIEAHRRVKDATL